MFKADELCGNSNTCTYPASFGKKLVEWAPESYLAIILKEKGDRIEEIYSQFKIDKDAAKANELILEATTTKFTEINQAVWF